MTNDIPSMRHMMAIIDQALKEAFDGSDKTPPSVSKLAKPLPTTRPAPRPKTLASVEKGSDKTPSSVARMGKSIDKIGGGKSGSSWDIERGANETPPSVSKISKPLPATHAAPRSKTLGIVKKGSDKTPPSVSSMGKSLEVRHRKEGSGRYEIGRGSDKTPPSVERLGKSIA